MKCLKCKNDLKEDDKFCHLKVVDNIYKENPLSLFKLNVMILYQNGVPAGCQKGMEDGRGVRYFCYTPYSIK